MLWSSDATIIKSCTKDGIFRRFYSPDFPAPSYPSATECSWRFRVSSGSGVGDVSITCDHFDVAGNYFDDCYDGDFLQVTKMLPMVFTGTLAAASLPDFL